MKSLILKKQFVLQLLIEHDGKLSSQVASQVDESGLSLVSLATLQGQSDHTHTHTTHTQTHIHTERERESLRV